MKKVKFLIILGCLAAGCLLCACKAAQETPTPYSYANMQRNVPSGNYMNYGDKVMFTRLKERVPGSRSGAFLLYVMDKATGEVRTFCDDASCPHTARDCYAANAASNVEEYNGRLYALNADHEIMELKNGRFEKIAKGKVRYFWHGAGRLFAVTWDNALVEIENEKKPPRVLIDEFVDFYNVVFGRYLYGRTSEGVSRVDLSSKELERELILPLDTFSLTDGQYIYYYVRENGEDHLWRCDMEGEGAERILDQWTSGISFDEEYLYFTICGEGGEASAPAGEHGLYRLSRAEHGRPELVAVIPEAQIRGIYTVPGYEKLFVEACRFVEDGDDAYELDELYLVGKENGSVMLLEMPAG